MKLISTVSGKPKIVEDKIQPLDEGEVIEIKQIALASRSITSKGVEITCKEGIIYILEEEKVE